MGNGSSVTISAIADNTTTLVPFQMTASVPATFTSLTDCQDHVFGFTVTKSGINEADQPDQGAYWYRIKADGQWAPLGNGGVIGLAVGNDTAAPPDGGVHAVPTFSLENICDSVYAAGSTDLGIAVYMSVIHGIKADGTSYEADFFAQHFENSAQPAGYYVVIGK
jgi:hypothetical protein